MEEDGQEPEDHRVIRFDDFGPGSVSWRLDAGGGDSSNDGPGNDGPGTLDGPPSNHPLFTPSG